MEANEKIMKRSLELEAEVLAFLAKKGCNLTRTTASVHTQESQQIDLIGKPESHCKDRSALDLTMAYTAAAEPNPPPSTHFDGPNTTLNTNHNVLTKCTSKVGGIVVVVLGEEDEDDKGDVAVDGSGLMSKVADINDKGVISIIVISSSVLC
ncbi:hypothetical protein B9479_003992 [Cryptococcus floricola]|uniref:Uncharacterized protein n=1 Tax=Cryptococcus floricola TaxID=2591691 RepID=A0A5D3AYV1_9TREE|nr:hypothetical protein B9479_003992 [Cryptococcus floricola]